MILSTIVPNNYFMPWEAVKCWFKVSSKYPIVYCQGPDMAFNRNRSWEQAKGDHLLIIDSDIVFTEEDVAKIERHLDNGYDVVTGIYLSGKKPYHPWIFKRVPGDYALTPLKEGLNEIDACAAGFLGVNKNVIMAMDKDPFNHILEGEVFHDQDISFCHRLHEKGFKLWSDSSIKLGHIRTQTIYENV